MKLIPVLKLKLFADGADQANMLRVHANGFTCDFAPLPKLMRKVGSTKYEYSPPDKGLDAVPIIGAGSTVLGRYLLLSLIWARPTQLLKIFQARQVGSHIFTATTVILKKLHLVGKNLAEYSREMLKIFRDCGSAAGFEL
jgi:hypothetical protein